MRQIGLYVEEYGNKDGPLLLFLHGGGVGGWMWKKQLDYFPEYHCLVPDLPGHGRSGSMPFSIKGSAEEALRLIYEHSKGKEVYVIGFSLGAQVAIQMATMKPDLIDAGVIASALAKPTPHAEKWIGPLVRLSYPLVKQKWFSKLQAKTLYIGEEDFEQYYEDSKRMDCEVLVTILEENMAFRIPEQFGEARGRFLVLVGEKEKPMMKRSAEDIATAGKNCVAVLLPNIGHGAPMGNSSLFNLTCAAWLKGGELPEGCSILS